MGQAKTDSTRQAEGRISEELLYHEINLALNPPSSFTIKVGCGYGGETSNEFREYKNLIDSKGYNTIREKLNSLSLFDQLLSAISLEELSAQGILTQNEKDIVSKIKLSNKVYYLCNGCTGHYSSPIYEIFKHDPDDKSPRNDLELFKYELGFKGEGLKLLPGK
jgi:hypothetical protein